MVVSSSWVILPNPRGIHNAGYSYGGVRPPTALASLDEPGGADATVLGGVRPPTALASLDEPGGVSAVSSAVVASTVVVTVSAVVISCSVVIVFIVIYHSG